MKSSTSSAAVAREHYASRDFVRAFEKFSEADEISRLSAEDLEAFAWSAALSGRNGQQIALFERLYADRLHARELAGAARAACWLGFRLLSVGERSRGGVWLGRAETLVREQPPQSAEKGIIALLDAWKCLAAGDTPAALEAAGRAQGIGAAAGDRDVQALARNLTGRALIAAGQVEPGLRALDDAMLTVVSDELSPQVAGLVYCSAVAACHSVFALDRCKEWTSAFSESTARRPELLLFSGACLVTRAELMQMQGAWDAAEREARRALDQGRAHGAAYDAAAAAYQIAELQRLRGDYESAETSYREAMRQGMDPQPGLSLLRLALGNAAAAAASIRRICGSAANEKQRLRHLPAAVEIFVAAGHLDEATACADALRAVSAKMGTDILAAVSDHAQATILLASGDKASALTLARRALQVWRSVDAPYLAARMRVLVARACTAAGDHTSARWELEAALQEFQSLGARPDVRITRDLLRDCDAFEPGEGAHHPLTPREVQVVRLVARGLSNKTIARELSLSDKTVDRHLSNIFDKLGVGSRTAAATYAIEKRLIAPESLHA